MLLSLDTKRMPMPKLFYLELGFSSIYEDYRQYLYLLCGRDLFIECFETLLMRFEQ